MNNNIKELTKRFINVKKKGWVKSLRKGSTGIGYTFETLIEKKEDNQNTPDFKTIEIKTMKYLSKQKIHLLSMTPDGDTDNPIRTVLSKLGYPDNEYPNYKRLNVVFSGKEYAVLGYKRIKAVVNWEKKKIELKAYSTYGSDYNLNISWSFKTLKKYYNKKLNYLAVVKACYKKIDGNDYFYYNKIEYYKSKDFKTFLKLIEEGIISIAFKISVYKDQDRLGKIHDRGTDFSIMYKDITLLFDYIET